MMKKIMLIGLILITMLAVSCNSSPTSTKKVKKVIEEAQNQITEDSIMKDSYKRATNDLLFDTSNLSTAPVKILKSRLVKEDYSGYRNIELTYKNISDKNISGIKFRWYGLDAFGDPADMGNYEFKGFGGGETDDGLRPGRIDNNTWDILSESAKKIIKAWPVEVVFADGSKWEGQ